MNAADMPFALEALISVLLVTGALFALVGSLGLVRLKDFFMRLHGPTKASTLGLGLMLIASFLYFTARQGSPSVHEVLVTAFLFVTAPVSAHMMAKAALYRRVDNTGPSRHYPED